MSSLSMFRLAAAAALAGLMASPVAAHHSYAAFERDGVVTFKGNVLSVDWSNPHVILMLQPLEGPPMRVEWNDIRRLSLAGVTKDDLQPGDHVIITGARHKDPQVHIMTLLQSLRRPADGWTWSGGGLANGKVEHLPPPD